MFLRAAGIRRSVRWLSQVTGADVDAFKAIVGEKGVLTEDLQKYTTCWLGKYSGECPAVVRVSTVEETSAVMKYCHEKNIGVVPQGGNTGLVGGSVPTGGEIVLSLERMNKVLDVDALSRVAEVQAGVILQSLEDDLQPHGLTVPLDLAAKGSCMIGGNVATNAGGIRFLRYGTLHANVLGLRVVLADGEILDLRNRLPKDNTGYDLKQLFIGSEGTLGVITDVILQVPSILKSTQVALLGCDSFDDVLQTMQLARQELGEIVSAFEFADAECVRMSQAHTGNRQPFPETPPFYLLVETIGSNEEHDMEKLSNFLEAAMEKYVTAGTIAQDTTQAKLLWAVRENITVSFKDFGKKNLKYDISLPTEEFYKCVEDTQARLDSELGGTARAVGFGHIGDGNLHLNIISNDPAAAQAMEPWLYEWLTKRGGSVSAEHGIGLMKRNALQYSKTPEAINMMRLLKKTLDPSGILNPLKVL
ncbi:putative D-2-hydroxyglutarate dehydrogenase [Diplonema papillatum]|nr:putative D-2-hydroxyglutarate dehydrogenase [Diplonema papillatum]